MLVVTNLDCLERKFGKIAVKTYDLTVKCYQKEQTLVSCLNEVKRSSQDRSGSGCGLGFESTWAS